MSRQLAMTVLFLLGILITAQGQNVFAPKVDLYHYSQEKWDSLDQLDVESTIELEWGSHDDVWVIDKPDSCICKGYHVQKFFLWEISGKQYLQKITCCRIYAPRSFQSKDIFKMLDEEQAILAKENYQTTSVSPSRYIQLKYKDDDGKRFLLFFDQGMIDRHWEPEYWRENRKLRTHKVLKKVVRMVNREWNKLK